MLLRLADPDELYSAVRLCSDLPLEQPAFELDDGEWRLDLSSPPVTRLEYELEVVRRDGTSERLEKSVMLLPGYREPDWLEQPGVEGRTESLEVRGRGLGTEVPIEIWSPTTDPDEPLPLLVAHDGPDYEGQARLTHFAATQIQRERLPPHRIALVAAKDREEWYSASARYAGALTRDLLPAITNEIATRGAPVGMGASLGALAMLHAQRRHPGTFSALFLQSGSFFVPRFDAHEARFPRYPRVVRFVRATLKGSAERDVVMTCGKGEENIHNNRLMARALQAELHELPDLHNFTAWRDAFDPHLTRLLDRAWRPRTT